MIKPNSQVQKIVFDFYQNIQLNNLYNEKKNIKDGNMIFYQLDSGKKLIINFTSQTVQIDKSGKGKLIKRISKTLERNKDYTVWQISLDYGWKFYTEEFQKLV